MKKRLIAGLLVLVLLLSLCGCGAAGKAGNGKPTIVCTAFPHYDWVRSILGNKLSDFNVTLLLNNGTDLHNYQPSAADLITISTCDLFIYIGGESDKWAADALLNPTNKERVCLPLIEAVEVIHTEHDEDEADAEHHHDIDEHIWLSLKNAAILVQKISAEICLLDPENEASYKANTDSYLKKLNELDAKYEECVENAETDTLVFAGQFPFTYMAEDYDLECHAASNSCSAEMGPGVARLLELAQIVDREELPAVLMIETTTRGDAEAIVSATESKDQELLVMDSLQSVTTTRIEAGVNYLKIMESNLEILKKALY